MHTPFGEKTRLDVPSVAEPGRPFSVALRLCNESTKNLTTPVVRFAFPEGITAQNGMLYVDGKAQNKAAFESATVVRVKLPTLKPEVERSIEVTCTVDVPTDDGMVLPISVEITATAHSREISATVIANSAPRFAAEEASLDIDGDDEIAEGEARDGYLSLVNEGTAVARDVVVDLRPSGLVVGSSSHELLDGSRIALGDVRPGEPVGIEFSVTATGDPDASLRPTMTVGGVACDDDLPSRSFRIVSGPLFEVGTSALYRRGDVSVLPGSVATIGVRLQNTGGRTARAPFVELDLPEGVRAVAGDAIIEFRDVAPGACADGSIMLTFNVNDDVEIGASIYGTHDLAPLHVPIGAQTSFAPVRIGLADAHHFESREDVEHFESVALAEVMFSPRVRSPFGFLFEVLNEGNAPCGAELGLRLAQHMEFVPSTLRVNGLRVNDAQFVQGGIMRFGNIEPGAVISLTVRIDALRPTLRGATTAITGVVRWNGHETALGCVPFSVLPAALYPGNREQLPFTILDDPALAAASPLVALAPPVEASEPPVFAPAVRPAVVAEVAPETASAAPAVAAQRGNDPPLFGDGTTTGGASSIETGAPAQAVDGVAADPANPADGVPPLSEDVQHDESEGEYTFAPMVGRDRARVGEIVARVDPSNRGTLAFYLALGRALLPTSAMLKGVEDLTYDRARKGFTTLTTVAITKLGSQTPVAEKDVQRFIDAGQVYAARYADELPEFASAKSDRPSIAACVSALLIFCGLQLVEDNERDVVSSYVGAVIDTLAPHDGLAAADFGAVMLQPTASDLGHHVAAVTDLFAEAVAV